MRYAGHPTLRTQPASLPTALPVGDFLRSAVQPAHAPVLPPCICVHPASTEVELQRREMANAEAILREAVRVLDGGTLWALRSGQRHSTLRHRSGFVLPMREPPYDRSLALAAQVQTMRDHYLEVACGCGERRVIGLGVMAGNRKLATATLAHVALRITCRGCRTGPDRTMPLVMREARPSYHLRRGEVGKQSARNGKAPSAMTGLLTVLTGLPSPGNDRSATRLG